MTSSQPATFGSFYVEQWDAASCTWQRISGFTNAVKAGRIAGRSTERRVSQVPTPEED